MEPGPGQSPVEPDKPRPRIVLEFDGPGLANVTMRSDGVQAAQLYAAAWYLDAVARGHFAETKIAAAMEAQRMAELAMSLQNGRKA